MASQFLLGVTLSLTLTLTSASVDSSTLHGKFMFGYQGWFATPCDGSGLGWWHWSRKNNTPGPDPNHEGKLNFDNWPDLTEFNNGELCATDLTYSDGSVAGLFSSANRVTVGRHFKWLKDQSIHGVFKQRILTASGWHQSKLRVFNDRVTRNVQAAAEAHGRVWAMMYCISKEKDSNLVNTLRVDWNHLVNNLNILSGSRYLHHRGKPLVVIWGLGKHTRDTDSSTALEVQAFFQSIGVTLMGGVPDGWRDLTRGSKTDKGWADVYRAFDVISPWTVGRYTSDNDVTEYMHDVIKPDMDEAAAVGSDYMPVVFPGESAHYEPRNPIQPLNRLSRRGGQFFWKQLAEFVGNGGASMLYGAMFDEVNEGTAFFKIATRKEDMPSNAAFIDDYNSRTSKNDKMPTDWWLQLAGMASRVLAGEEDLPHGMPHPPGMRGDSNATVV